MRRALLSLVAVLLASPGKAADPVLAPSGTLRAAYIGPNVAQARLDPATGTISGVAADIARSGPQGRRAGQHHAAPDGCRRARGSPERPGRHRIRRTEPGAHRRRALLPDVHAGV